ncbi:MAG: T9SS type A sorting domain-containing protein [Bacteroidetes bacterium]|nr:T9SS type A sorting domain-containing protein [Bacteroidota bacterium]
MNAGIQSVKFDASNLSSGLYFYRISTGGFVNVKKMLLLK